ncbi:c-type cytochrome [Frigidibacter oleivorans]|uniref:c-type cytochrome n=1 Tax=Frigidibacter oleivorans TaxID=2487129 RepID=UPI000F8D1745|nr:c-type cytochrome [Frigidibacter oleivorans]
MIRPPSLSPDRPRALRLGGALTLLTALAAPAAEAQSADGERLFRQRCAACHSIEEGATGSGPSLHGVVGREAGTLEGARYSSAMQEAGLVWDDQTLDAFLANPRDTVPGTTMAVRITSAAQRSAIIAFLREAGAGG